MPQCFVQMLVYLIYVNETPGMANYLLSHASDTLDLAQNTLCELVG